MSEPRIASLLASATEMLYALGLGEQVVAVSHECDFPAEVRHKPRVTRAIVDDRASSAAIDEQVKTLSAAGSALYDIDVETLQTLRPDLIVTQAHCDVCAVSLHDVERAVRTVPALQGANIVALNPTGLEEVLADLLRVGRAANREPAARHLVDSLKGHMLAVSDRMEDARRRGQARPPRVVCLEWIEPLMVAANWMPDLVRIAGGDCPLTQPGQRSTYADWADIRAFDPEVIVVMPCGFDLSRSLAEAGVLSRLPDWERVQAVRNRRVFAVDGNAYFNRSGPRLIDSLEILAAILHPDLFPGELERQESVVRRLRI